MNTLLKNDIKRVVLYASFYDEEETGDQIGWLIPPLFKYENNTIKLNIGKFTMNLIKPPA